MTIDKNTVKKVASLARMHMADDTLEKMTAELNNILSWIEQLNEIETDDVKPMTSVKDMLAELRADKVTDGGYTQDILKNAPNAEHGFFAVPKVVE